MSKIYTILNELSDELQKVDYVGDLGDVGNEIGIIIGKHISDEMGYELDDFISGVKHGVSLVDETH